MESSDSQNVSKRVSRKPSKASKSSGKSKEIRPRRWDKRIIGNFFYTCKEYKRMFKSGMWKGTVYKDMPLLIAENLLTGAQRRQSYKFQEAAKRDLSLIINEQSNLFESQVREKIIEKEGNNIVGKGITVTNSFSFLTRYIDVLNEEEREILGGRIQDIVREIWNNGQRSFVSAFIEKLGVSYSDYNDREWYPFPKLNLSKYPNNEQGLQDDKKLILGYISQCMQIQGAERAHQLATVLPSIEDYPFLHRMRSPFSFTPGNSFISDLKWPFKVDGLIMKLRKPFKFDASKIASSQGIRLQNPFVSPAAKKFHVNDFAKEGWGMKEGNIGRGDIVLYKGLHCLRIVASLATPFIQQSLAVLFDLYKKHPSYQKLLKERAMVDKILKHEPINFFGKPCSRRELYEAGAKTMTELFLGGVTSISHPSLSVYCRMGGNALLKDGSKLKNGWGSNIITRNLIGIFFSSKKEGEKYKWSQIVLYSVLSVVIEKALVFAVGFIVDLGYNIHHDVIRVREKIDVSALKKEDIVITEEAIFSELMTPYLKGEWEEIRRKLKQYNMTEAQFMQIYKKHIAPIMGGGAF